MASESVTILVTLRDKFSAPLGKIGKGFKSVKKDVDKLNASFGGLAAKIGGVIASIASVRGVQAAIDLAETQVQAERALLQSLQGRRSELEKIKVIASSIQSSTTIGDEQLLQTASLLINMGVSVENIEKALKATVDTAAALSVPFESAAKAVGLFEAGRAGELGERIAELKELQEEGTLAAKGVQTLLDKFGGAAAALATTEFGKIQQQMNEIGDTGEEIGIIFVELKTVIVEGLNVALKRFRELLDTTFFRGIFNILKDIAGLISGAAPEILALIAAVVAIKLAVIVGPLVILAAKLGLIAVAVVKIGGFLLKMIRDAKALGGVLSPVLGFFGDIATAVTEVFELFADGKLTVEDFFDFVGVAIDNLFTRIEGFFVNPVISLVQGLATTIRGILGLLSINIIRGINFALNVIITTVLKAIKGLVGAIDVFTDLFADALELLPGQVEGAFDSMRTSLAASIPTSIKLLDDFEAKLKESSDAAKKDFLEGIPNAIQEVADSVEKTNNFIAFENEALERRFAERAQQRSDEELDGIKANGIKRIAEQLKILSEIEELEKRHGEFVRNENAQGQKLLGQQRLADLQVELDREKIARSAFLDAREQIELGSAQKILLEKQKEVELIEIGILRTRQRQGADADVRLELQQLLKKRKEEQVLLFGVRDLERDIGQQRIQFATDVVSGVNAAREALNTEIQLNQSLVESGNILAEDAAGRNVVAVQKFQTLVGESRAELASILGDTTFSADLDLFQDKLTNLATVELPKTSDSIEGFFDGIAQGAQQAVAAFQDLGKVGVQMGQQLTVAFADGLTGAISSFIQGTKSAKDAFKDFAASFLAQIGQMILRTLLLRAIGGFIGGGAGAAVAGAGGFNKGGLIPGGGPDRDTVNIRATPGEGILTRKAMQHYGVGLLSALNNRMIPKGAFSGMGRISNRSLGNSLNHGGQVEDRQGENGTNQILVANNEVAETIFNGGREAFLRFANENSQDLKSALGIA